MSVCGTFFFLFELLSLGVAVTECERNNNKQHVVGVIEGSESVHVFVIPILFFLSNWWSNSSSRARIEGEINSSYVQWSHVLY